MAPGKSPSKEGSKKSPGKDGSSRGSKSPTGSSVQKTPKKSPLIDRAKAFGRKLSLRSFRDRTSDDVFTDGGLLEGQPLASPGPLSPRGILAPERLSDKWDRLGSQKSGRSYAPPWSGSRKGKERELKIDKRGKNLRIGMIFVEEHRPTDARQKDVKERPFIIISKDAVTITCLPIHSWGGLGIDHLDKPYYNEVKKGLVQVLCKDDKTAPNPAYLHLPLYTGNRKAEGSCVNLADTAVYQAGQIRSIVDRLTDESVVRLDEIYSQWFADRRKKNLAEAGLTPAGELEWQPAGTPTDDTDAD